MADVKPPVLVEPIADITLNVGSELSVDLRDHIHNTSDECGAIRFVVTLDDGAPLPEGLDCSPEGLISGVVTKAAMRPEPYHLLIIAKNLADVPLITYSDLIIVEALAVDEGSEETAEDVFEEDVVPEQPEIDEPALPGDELPKVLGDALGDDAKDAMDDVLADREGKERLSPDEYKNLFIEHMLRKFSSLQIYNAEFDGELTMDPLIIEKAASGWDVYVDGDFSISTTNPKAFGGYLNRGSFVSTVDEMVNKAVEKGWRVVGVAGFDKQVGLKVVHMHNFREKQKPANEQRRLEFDEIFQDPEWVQEVIQGMNVQPGSDMN